MNQLNFRVIGLMSGTSLDGLDIAFLEFGIRDDNWTFEILKSETFPYTNYWFEALSKASSVERPQLEKLSKEYGSFLGEQTNRFMARHNIDSVDLIASHGHTVHHQPEQMITVQIGNGPELHLETGNPVVCDFRVQDVLLGGQGAPLVPIGDELLFEEYGACLNLGGFANISFQNRERIAFDICPVNIALNSLSQSLGKSFDEDGKLARSGVVIHSLLDTLNSKDYYKQPHPKSLGREWVEKEIFPLFTENENKQNLLRTFCEHVAIQISDVCNDLPNKKVLVTGGGAFNLFLIERLKTLSKAEFVIPNKDLVNYKEALIFAFLGVLRYKNLPNVLASVTGAKQNHSSGRIYK